MQLWRLLRSVLLFPWHLLLAVRAVAGRLLLSVRAWALFILTLIAVLIAYYALSDRYTPYTTDAYVQAYVVQVAAQVEGQVIKVHVRENQTVTKDEVLFEIDPRPFEYKVAQLKAKLIQMEKQVAQLESELAVAQAEEAKIIAEEAYAREVFKQETEIYNQESTTKRKYQDAVQKYEAAQALRKKSRSAVEKVEQALAARINTGEHVLVVEAKAQLTDAELNLAWTKVRAPVNGYVTDLQLREGSYAHVGKPVLTCIDADQWWIVANYRENCLERLQPGQPAKLTLNTYPGRVFHGTVHSVGWGVVEGQGMPSGNLPAVRDPKQWIRLAQRFQVRVKPELPAEYPLRVGATATVTVYTTDGHWLNPVAEAWQQVVAWFDYLY